MSDCSIETLVQNLRREFLADERGAGAAKLLTSYTACEDDWQRYAFFSGEHYTRNLVHSDELFELMVVCWSPDQESPIHNHAGSNCWMGVLKGEVEEVHFDPPGDGIPPKQRQSRVYQRGQVAFIRDEIALHLVRPAGDGPAASLHLYSKPIESCQLYCPETGKVEDRDMCFYTVKGEPVGA